MIDYSSVSYDNHVIIGEFNLQPSTGLLKNFMNSNALRNLIKVDLCFKGKGTCIDLILANQKYYFNIILADHDYMIYTMLKSTSDKSRPY